MSDYNQEVETARSYYNSDDADTFYYTIWGGEDIHIGLYQSEQEDIFTASQRTVEKMASLLNINENSLILDIGSGYGGAARYFARTFNCHVDCLNLSEVQNKRNREINQEQGLSEKITVIDGSFEDIPASNETYDIVWSQDSILHSNKREQVLQEVYRTLKPSGEFIFTDPMQADNCPEGVLQPIYDRIHLESLGSFGYYTKTAEKIGFSLLNKQDITEQLTRHYGRVLQEIEKNEEKLATKCSQAYIEKMKAGLGHWVEGGKSGYLAWGILHFRK